MLGNGAGCFIFESWVAARSAEKESVSDTLKQLHPRVPVIPRASPTNAVFC